MDEATMTRLKSFIVNSNEALELKLIRKVQEIEDEKTSFKPEMSHQVFGESETIFGYKDLKVKLYYAAGCLETYMGMTYSEKVNNSVYDGVEPDNILQKLSEVLAPGVHDNIDSFIKSLQKDNTFRPCGEIQYSCSVNNSNSTRYFEVYRGDVSDNKFREYHKRLQTFILWYIDAANFIDIDDEQWQFFNMYERYTSESGETRYATVGFSTVYQYYAYPHHTRPRIAQMLILPPFQNMGLGAHLLRAIYLQYINCNEVKDITVEDPSVNFQRIRDFVDAQNCRMLPSFSKSCLMEGFSKAMAQESREKFKINKKQARRIYEILRLAATDLSNENEYREYRLNVKKRLNIPYKREQNDMKKLETALMSIDKRANAALTAPEQRMQTLEKEYRALEEEYKKVIQRLEKENEKN